MTGRAPEVGEATATGGGAETDTTPSDTTPSDTGPPAGSVTAVRPALFAALPALVTVVVAALVLAAGAYPLLGLADPGPVVRVATPVLRVLADLTAAACLGVLVRALLLDAPRAGPSPALLRIAAAAAAGWAVAAAGTALLTVADVSGGSLAGEDLLLGLLVRAAPLGWLLTAVLAAVVAVWAREVRTWSSGAGVFGLAAVALLGPVVTGHAIDGVGHDLGLPATAWHVVAATVWLGTLGAGAVGADARTRWRAHRVTGACAAVVLASGVVQALVLVPRAADWASAYGVLVALAAVVTLVALPRPGGGGTGRTPGPGTATDGPPGAAGPGRTGPRGTSGTSGARWIAAELALLGVVTGLSVAMTRAVPPVQDPGHASPPEALLGYALADPPSALTLLTHWRPDLWFTPLAVVLAVGYAVALRRAPGWPRGRAACWFAGCAVLVVATSSGLGRYGPALLSVHVAAHMLLSTVVPILLVLGGPVTLLRRVLPEPGTSDGVDDREGPRDWLEHALAAPTLRGISHPLVATVLMVGSPFLLYLTPVFSLTQPIGWLQPPMTAWFLGVGLVFAWVLVGVDPSPHPVPYVARLTLLLASMPFHAVFGVLLLSADEPISRTPSTLVDASGGGQVFVADFYQRLGLPWAPDLLADQQLAAALTWAMGDLPLLAAVVVLLVQWQRHAAAEDRATREEFVGLRS